MKFTITLLESLKVNSEQIARFKQAMGEEMEVTVENLNRCHDHGVFLHPIACALWGEPYLTQATEKSEAYQKAVEPAVERCNAAKEKVFPNVGGDRDAQLEAIYITYLEETKQEWEDYRNEVFRLMVSWAKVTPERIST